MPDPRAQFRVLPPIAAILLVAFALRVWGIGFGLPHTFARPDEDASVSIALRFFQRKLHPEFFHWPTLFMTVVAAVYVVFFNIGRKIGWYPLERIFLESAALYPTTHYLIPRFVSMSAGVANVWVVYRLSLRLFDRTTALIAALFLAVAALHVRDSHFGVTDVMATCLATLSFLYTARFAREGTRRPLVLSALFAGLAASTKYNCGLIVLPALWAIVFSTRAASGRLAVAGRTGLYAGVAIAAFVAGTPYSVVDFPAFLTAMQEITAHLQGGHAAVAGPAWITHVTISLRYGLGLPLLVTAVAGVLLYVLRDWRHGVLFAIFPILYFAVVGAGQTAFARYILPIVPFLCVAAAYFVVTIARVVADLIGRPVSVAAAWLIAIVLAAPSAWSAVRTDLLLSNTDNRVIAAEWIYRSFPDGVTMHQTGSGYGQVQIKAVDPFASPRFPELLYDEGANAFRHPDGSAAAAPHLIVVQESPLTYSTVPEAIRRVVDAEYELRQTFTALDSDDPSLVFDPDDAFYLPLAGFDAVSRPGPNVSIYVRREGAIGSSGTARSEVGSYAGI